MGEEPLLPPALHRIPSRCAADKTTIRRTSTVRSQDQRHLPEWAVHRIASALGTTQAAHGARTHPAELARRTGMSKSLARRCLHFLQDQDCARQPADQAAHR
ncbi:helix-turn-helix domain-containing protein [Streptomyces sp. enrichment culture]|uniref:helix-turn-helix domain-containing protein n=1 Tax=Streptomyces sp. enrichment culture TaxID=1795815 RepID=UPI003F562EA5